MKNKMHWWKKVLLTVAILILLIIIIAVILFWRVIRTATSVEKLEDGLYSMEYQGDYHFNGFLEAGGASSNLAVADYVIQDVAYGLVDLHLQGYGFGCSTMAASDGTGGSLFGRKLAVRLLLDRAASVDEAVELLSQYDLHASAGMMVHFAIAEAAVGR